MTINQSGWKPTSPEQGAGETGTWTGNRALMLEEPLLFLDVFQLYFRRFALVLAILDVLRSRLTESQCLRCCNGTRSWRRLCHLNLSLSIFVFQSIDFGIAIGTVVILLIRST